MSSLAATPVHCWVYKSSRKDEMYLFLTQEDVFADLPAELREGFGRPALVMELDLHTGRRLAREDVAKVIDNLRDRGFHLQLPPDLQPWLYRGE